MRKKVLLVLLLFAISFHSFATQTLAEPLAVSTLLGDTNGDGIANAGDALAVLRYAVNKSSAILRTKNAGLMGDTDGNGLLEAADALEILQFSVNTREAFSAQTAKQPFGTVCTAQTDWWSPVESRFNTAYLPHPGFEQLKSTVYSPLYFQYGFASAPGMLEYVENHIARNGSALGVYQWVALLPICFNLQLDTQGCLLAFAGAPANPEAYTWEVLLTQFKEFVASVPEEVTAICQSDQMTYEEQQMALSRYGLLALPFLAERIEAGETQWEVCFENQLLGVPYQQRIDILAAGYSADIGWADASPTDLSWQQQIFRHKTAAALPVDALGWCEAHQEQLTVLKNWCLAIK